MPKSSKSKSSRKKAPAESASNNKSSKTTFKFCPFTGEKIWITTVTLSELKRAAKTGECPSSRKKELIRIPSKSEREKLLEDAAEAIAARELDCLPSYGGRPWTVQCKLTEPKHNKKPPLFRWFRGQLELACLPHLLERVPDPPRLRGKSLLLQDEDEYVPTTALQERVVSALSEMAWNDDEYGIPEVRVKYMSPNHTTWIGSRKAAYELRDQLMEHTLLLDKVLHGYGARGQELKPFKPSKAVALQVGKLRFERDGLWVVGQEEAWQEERAERMMEQISKIGSKVEQVETAPTLASGKEESSSEGSKKRTMTGLSLFIQSKRDSYRAEKTTAERQREIEEAAAAASTVAEAAVATVPAASESTEPTTTMAAESAVTDQAVTPASASAPKPFRMTLRDAERELRDVWKTLPSEEQKQWKARAQEYEKQKEAQATSGAAEKTNAAATEPEAVLEKAAADLKDADTQIASTSGVSSTTSAAVTANVEVDMNPASQPPEEDAKVAAVETSVPASGPGSKVLEVTQAPKEIPATSHVNLRPLVSPSPPIPHSASEDDSVKNNEQPVVPVLPKKRRAPSTCPPRQIQRSSHWRLKPEHIDLCYQAAMDHYDMVMNTVKARALHNELQDGFDLLRERGRGRFDMELPIFDTPQFSFLTDLHKAAWMPIVRQILGEDVVLIHKGAFLSMPGAASQEYHQDGPHLNKKQQRPCHAINVFIPLVDLHPRNGPTEFCLGTHYLNFDRYVREQVESPLAPAGTPVIFDYRLGHRGMANTSQCCRPIVYCTYAAASNGKEFRDSVNFSRKRYHRIGDLVEKPLSRDERVKRRRQNMAEQQANEEMVEEEDSLENEETKTSGGDEEAQSEEAGGATHETVQGVEEAQSGGAQTAVHGGNEGVVRPNAEGAQDAARGNGEETA